MSLSQRLRLDLDDGRQIETTYDGRDLMAWEDYAGESSLVKQMDVRMLTWLGHHAAVRNGDLNGDLKTWDAFREVCTSVEGVRGDPPVAPAKRGKASPRSRGAASSAPSPSEPASP